MLRERKREWILDFVEVGYDIQHTGKLLLSVNGAPNTVSLSAASITAKHRHRHRPSQINAS
jgi:hypothetical protein